MERGGSKKLLAIRGLSIVSGQIVTKISGSNTVWPTRAEHAHLHCGRKEK